MILTPEIIKDAAQYADFAQWFKMQVWAQTKKRGKKELVEQDLDDLAAKIWKHLKKNKTKKSRSN